MPDIPGLIVGEDNKKRCRWSGTSDPMISYHDHEWGMPVDDDYRLFEKICLEGFQSGLSWLTVLKKRPAFREAFDDFDFERVARFTKRRVDKLVKNAEIIRHRGKIESTINNAKLACEMNEELGGLAPYFWQFEPKNRPKKITHDVLKTMTTSSESISLSKDLKKRGWTFVGPTTMYAFMQAMGMVNDHLHGCSARASVEAARKAFVRPKMT